MSLPKLSSPWNLHITGRLKVFAVFRNGFFHLQNKLSVGYRAQLKEPFVLLFHVGDKCFRVVAVFPFEWKLVAYAIVERLPADLAVSFFAVFSPSLRYVITLLMIETTMLSVAVPVTMWDSCSGNDFDKNWTLPLRANYDRKLKPFQLFLIEKVLSRVQSNTNLRFITVASAKPFDTLIPLHSLFS